MAGFIKSTEGVLSDSWQARLDDMGTPNPVDAISEADATFASTVKSYLRSLDNDETGMTLMEDPKHDQRKELLTKGALQAVLGMDFDTVATGATQPRASTTDTATMSQAESSNFCATGITEPCRTGATAEPRNDRVHVVVQTELDPDQTARMQLSSAATSTLLHTPYRSMTARLGVVTAKGLKRLLAVIDTGAAQSAVSARWLRDHPDLWDSRTTSPHRFHGITGEPLHVDGVVRLTLKLGQCYIDTWAHVFTHMKSELLLGTNAIVENSIVIDGDQRGPSLQLKSDPTTKVPICYKLDTEGEMLQVTSTSGVLHEERMRQSKTQVFPSPVKPIAVVLTHDVTVPPASTSPSMGTKQGEVEGRGLLFNFDSPMIGKARDYWVSAGIIPGLELTDALVNSSQRYGYLPVSNVTDQPIVLEAGTPLGTAYRHHSEGSIVSNEEGVGRLTFGIQLAQQQQEVTEATLKRNGASTLATAAI